jgi:hypothetical protein
MDGDAQNDAKVQRMSNEMWMGNTQGGFPFPSAEVYDLLPTFV